MNSHAYNKTIQHIITRTRGQDTKHSLHGVSMDLPAHFNNACWPEIHARWILKAHVLLFCFHAVLNNMTHIFDNNSWFLCKHLTPWIRHTCFLTVLMLSLITHDTHYLITHEWSVDMCHGFHPYTQTHHNQVPYFLYQHMFYVRSRLFPVSCAVFKFISCHK
jgi:hypothetical protein